MIFIVQEHKNKGKDQPKVEHCGPNSPWHKEGAASFRSCTHLLIVWRLPILQYLFTGFAVCCFSGLLASLFGSGNKKSSDFWYKKTQNEQMYSCKSQERVEAESLYFPHFHVPPGRCHLGSAAPVPRLVEPWAQAVPWRSSHSSAGVWLCCQARNGLCRQGWLSAAAAVGLWGHGFLHLVTLLSIRSLSGKSS